MPGQPTRSKKVTCPCCGRLVTQRTVRNHLEKARAPRNETNRSPGPSQSITEDDDIVETLVQNGGEVGDGPLGATSLTGDPTDPTSAVPGPSILPSDEEMEMGSDASDEVFDWEVAREQFLREDWMEEAEGMDDRVAEEPPTIGPGDWGLDTNDNEDEFDSDVEDELDEEWRQKWEEEWLAEGQRLYESGLSEEDIDNLSMYAIRLDGRLSRKVYNHIRRAFPHRLGHLRTEYRLQKLVDELADLEVQEYHCCVGSCCLFVDDFADASTCPYCTENRYDDSGRPRQTFLYIPIIPRLVALFANPRLIEQLRYRHCFPTDVHQPGSILDIFDCDHYRDLCDTRVNVNGKELDHKYFSSPDDIALGFAGDGIQVFKKVRRGNATVTPMILINYNLEPRIRTRLSNVYCLGVIPGPHGPKDTNSWIWPFKQECDKLAAGVSAYHAIDRKTFPLHAYNIFGLGDIPWISKIMCIKGHNGFCPCRACDIQGVRNPHLRTAPYYVPLFHPLDDPRPDVDPRSFWDPANLPLRPETGPDSWENRIASILDGHTKKERDRRARIAGINGKSIMSTIPGIVMTRSFPYEGMHIFFENLIPNMINHWKGEFKTLDSGTQDYIIEPSVWETIGRETEASVRTIPSTFVGKLPDIYTSQYLYKAEYYSFWFIYLAPILLQGRFKQTKYYEHACNLSKILKKCLEIEITRVEVQQLKQDMIKWVVTYEDYYYQKKLDRLEACPLTIHGLLHVPDEIIRSAPVWASWSFIMERFAGNLILAVKSRRNPNAVLALRVKRVAQLNHIKNKFNLHERLDFDRVREDPNEVTQREKMYPTRYPLTVLRFPKKLGFQPDSTLRHKIAVYFKPVLEESDSDWPTLSEIMSRLPAVMPKWCKVRVKNGGDAIRGSDAKPNPDKDRDSSFVRFTQIADRNARYRNVPSDFERQVRYGQLHSILVCELPKSNILRLTEPKVYLLAHITPCDTSVRRGGREVWPDATQEVVSYKNTMTSIIVDVSAVEVVVGRVEYGIAEKKWGIIDRSGEGARTTFVDQEGWDDDEDI